MVPYFSFFHSHTQAQTYIFICLIYLLYINDFQTPKQISSQLFSTVIVTHVKVWYTNAQTQTGTQTHTYKHTYALNWTQIIQLSEFTLHFLQEINSVLSSYSSLRVPSNCARDFVLLAFEPGGDVVKCRNGDKSLSECNSCTPPSVLSLTPVSIKSSSLSYWRVLADIVVLDTGGWDQTEAATKTPNIWWIYFSFLFLESCNLSFRHHW